MRIITGSAKGMRLLSPKGDATRPTSDRIKESVFSVLGGDITDKRVIDVFAGTGALGLEALSRGATSAVFIDKDTADIIRKNCQKARMADCAEIISGDAAFVLERIARNENRRNFFDLAFTDPPYGKGLTEDTLPRLLPIMKDGGLIIAEHGGDEEIYPPSGLEILRRINYGRISSVSFLRKLL